VNDQAADEANHVNNLLTSQGDFTVRARVLWIGLLAVFIGAICALVAVLLLNLIDFFTNVFFFGTFSFEFHSPADHQLGAFVIFIPALGGLIIGLMARYGSERIRGHGIPEAMEAILIGRSRMQPKVAVLKPISSAISIGSGGPFGAEGPIIMTGGAFGSIIAQMFHLTSAERKTLLVAGAAGGMAATFGTPLAAMLLAVELLLFEWKPRSLIPVALASVTAALVRPYVLGSPPLFEVIPHAELSLAALLSCCVVGLAAGLLALSLTSAVYAAENLFHRLPIHWMWWPAIGGLIIGVGGYFQPHALGVGYDIIDSLVQGTYVPQALVGLLIVKCLIWSLSLGSGTSGGVLAPLLIAGGAMGALLSTILPGGDAALWPLVGMAAVMGGTMRSPMTGIVFALELTYDIRVLPALLLATIVSYGFTVLVMKRSILTEKVARRGFHISREYEVDPLERLTVADVMTQSVVTVPSSTPVPVLVRDFFAGSTNNKHQGYPVMDVQNRLIGVITRTDLLDEWAMKPAVLVGAGDTPPVSLIIAYDLLRGDPISIRPWESCRTAAEKMAQFRIGRLVVVSPNDDRAVVGIVTRSDLLAARLRLADEESLRERYIAFPRAAAG
jgi:chloride channel protein, CIC family